MDKKYLGANVLEAARGRISTVFDEFPRVYVSFSGGKDSTVMLHLVADEARKRGRKFGLMFVDLEAQYTLTIDHVRALYEEYSDCTEPYWVALPIKLRNAVSDFMPTWMCWEDGVEWVRQPDPTSITDGSTFPFFRAGMEFEEFTPEFGKWYGEGLLTCCMVGIRTQESLNRWRTIASGKKTPYEGLQWTTWMGATLYNAYPIYDWSTEDIWTYHAKNKDKAYNHLYDRMNMAGLTIHQQRICQPYGDDQRKGLWLYQVIEPETWGRVVARVNGANAGALYARESGNILGRLKVTLPPGHTWESFARLLLDSMPPQTRDHYEDKIAVFRQWWWHKGYEEIPDVADPKDEAAKNAPSWRRICKTLLRHDYWCKGLSFTQTKSTSYEQYKKVMKRRRAQWTHLAG